MKVGLGLIAGAAVLGGVTPALACSPSAPTPIEFSPGSAELRPDMTARLGSYFDKDRTLDSRCIAFSISVYTAKSELPIAAQLVSARREAIQTFLLGQGFHRATFNVNHASNSNDKGSAYVSRSWSEGRWRCDPVSKSEGPQTACAPIYAHCYLERPDGTVCNVFRVPDPSPQRYSVDPNGKKLD